MCRIFTNHTKKPHFRINKLKKSTVNPFKYNPESQLNITKFLKISMRWQNNVLGFYLSLSIHLFLLRELDGWTKVSNDFKIPDKISPAFNNVNLFEFKGHLYR